MALWSLGKCLDAEMMSSPDVVSTGDTELQYEAAADEGLLAGTAKLPVDIQQKLTALSPVSSQEPSHLPVVSCREEQCRSFLRGQRLQMLCCSPPNLNCSQALRACMPL